MIPVYDEPCQDEHILGWLMRLADMNDMKMNDFLDYYLPCFRWEHSADTVGNLFGMDFSEPLRLMRNNTLYCALFPFLTEGTQAKIIWRFLYGGDIHWYHTVTDMRFCPECMAEDVKSGRIPYYRVWHQLDEIHTCAKHKTGLWAIPKGKLGSLNEGNVLKAAKPVEVSDTDISTLIYDMYRDPVVTCLEKWGHDALDISVSRGSRLDAMKAGEKAGLSSEPGFQYLDAFCCKMCGETYIAHPFSYRATGICPSCAKKLSRQELIDLKAGGKGRYTLTGKYVKHKCGRTLSGGYHEFIWGNRECPCIYLPGLEDYQREFDDGEFSVVGFERHAGKTWFHVNHRKCGNTFKVGRTDFMNRRYCRCCIKSPSMRFEKQFYAMVGDEYKLLESPKTTGDYFKAVHRTCGMDFTMRARNFTEGQRCPFCQKNFGFDKTMELLKENADLTGYKIEDRSPDMLVTLPDGTQKRIRFAVAIQDLTRLDEPEIFVRKNRIEPIISEKAKVYLYIREHCDESGVFVSNKDYKKLDMTNGVFFSSVQYLKRSGHLLQLSKGVYQVTERRNNYDRSRILPTV